MSAGHELLRSLAALAPRTAHVSSATTNRKGNAAMTELHAALTGGYPVVALVTIAGEHTTCGWVLMSSDNTGTEFLETGAGTTGKALNAVLAEKLLVQAEQRSALIRTWRPQLNAAVIDAGGGDYLDVASNIRLDDEAYLAALDIATELCNERAGKRGASGPSQRLRPLVVAVDGSRSRAGDGAWAWINEDGQWEAEAGEYTSPLQAEVAAIAAALAAHPPGRELRILCDSRDAIAHVHAALAGQPIAARTANSVARILAVITRRHGRRRVELEWVKGHNGHPLNDRADRLAVHARRTGGMPLPEHRRIADSIADLTEELVPA